MTLAAKVFVVWYFCLWFICSWLFFENFYPHQTYGVIILNYLLIVFCSVSLLLFTGGPLYYIFRKRGNLQIKQKMALVLVFLVASISLGAIMVPLIHSSAVNKAMAQMYISELENQGFNVEYGEHYPYGHWHVEYVDSFSNFTRIAKDIECETIFVHGGVPSYFVFFVPPYIETVAAQTGQGYYMFVDNQYN